MKKMFLLKVILVFAPLPSFSQYSVDWGKYMNEPVAGANFSNDDESEQMAVDVKNGAANEEYVYVMGKSHSRNDAESACPTNTLYYGAEDAFLAKYDKCGSLQWFKFLGSDNDNTNDECGDFGDCIALDRDPITDSTYIYVAGYSYTNFNTSSCTTCLPCNGANSKKTFTCKGDTCVFQKNKNSEIDAYIAKYDENGSLLKWTYFGGEGDDYIIGIEVFNHDVFITGTIGSTTAFIPPGTPKFDSTLSTNLDAFAAQLDGNLCTLKFFSYMGGTGYERTHSIRCFKTSGTSPQTEFYMCGATTADLGDPSYHPLNSYKGGQDDAFLSLWRLNKSSGIFKPLWMQYIGGKAEERDRETIIDASNNAIVTGFTQSKNFISGTPWIYPKTHFYDVTYNGVKDVFIAKFDVNGNPLWGTFFGGSESDEARGLAAYSLTSGTTTTNYVAISGGTKSINLPFQALHTPFETELNGGANTTSRDAFVAVLTDPSSSSQEQELEFSSYFGGKNYEWSDAVVDYGPDLSLGGNDEIYLTFYTKSTNMENCITSQDYNHNTNSGNDNDAFLAKILNSTISGQFDCTSFNWGTNNPEKQSNLHESDLQLYPNPNKGQFTLNLKTNNIDNNENATIEVRNIIGETVFEKKYTMINGALQTPISLPSELSNGIFLVKVILNKSEFHNLLILQK